MQDVPRRPREEAPLSELLAQPRNGDVEALCGRRRRAFVPELGDQPVAGDDRVGMEQQIREQGPPLDAAKVEQTIALGNFQGGE